MVWLILNFIETNNILDTKSQPQSLRGHTLYHSKILIKDFKHIDKQTVSKF